MLLFLSFYFLFELNDIILMIAMLGYALIVLPGVINKILQI